jgi:hypothetical protein
LCEKIAGSLGVIIIILMMDPSSWAFVFSKYIFERLIPTRFILFVCRRNATTIFFLYVNWTDRPHRKWSLEGVLGIETPLEYAVKLVRLEILSTKRIFKSISNSKINNNKPTNGCETWKLL